MTDKSIKGIIGIEVAGADSAKQDLVGIQTAAEQMGSGGAAGATALTNAFENIERAADRVEKKLAAGATVTARDIAVMGQQYELLQQQIEKSFGALERAPAEIQAAFAKADAQFSQTTSVVRNLTDAVGDNAVKIKDGAGQVQHMGTAIEGLTAGMPPSIAGIGQLAGKIGSLGTAADAAKNAISGMNLNTLAASAPLAALGIQAAAVMAALAGATKAGGEMGIALGASQDSVDDYETGLKKVGLALVGLPGAWTQAKDALGAFTASAETGVSMRERLFSSTESLKDLEILYTRAMADGAAGQSFYADALKKSGGDVETLNGILEAGLPKIEAQVKATTDVAKATADHASKQREAKAAHEESATAAEKHRIKLDDVRTATDGVRTKNVEMVGQIHSSDYWTKLAETATGSLKTVYEKLAESAKSSMVETGKAVADAITMIAISDPSVLTARIHELNRAMQELRVSTDAATVALERLSRAGDDAAGSDTPSGDTMSWTPGGVPSTRKSGYGV